MIEVKLVSDLVSPCYSTGREANMTLKMIHCQTCGYKEPCKDIVVYCSQCKIVMVHKYCRDGPLRYDAPKWVCDDCCPIPHQREEAWMEGQYLKDIEGQNFKEEVQNENSQEVVSGEMKHCAIECETFKDDCFELLQNEDSLEVEREVDNACNPIQCALQSTNGIFNQCSHDTNQNEEAHMWSHPLKDDVYCETMKNEDTKETQVELKQVRGLVECALQSPKENSVDDFHLKQKPYDEFPRPIYSPLWRGNFMIHYDMHESICFQLVAHLCDTASSKVADALQTLPTTLNFKIVPKCSNLPKSCSMSGGDIGLYFFHAHESDEKQCSSLVEKMIDGKLILKFTRGDLNLLVLTSWDLPKELWSFNNKMYLWGVFYTASPSSLYSTKTISSSIRIVKDGKCGFRKNNYSKSVLGCIVQALPPSTSVRTKFQRKSRVDLATMHHHSQQTNGRKHHLKNKNLMSRTSMKVPARCSIPFQDRIQSRWENRRKFRDAILHPKPMKRNWI